ncbi:hypothetical protein ACIBKZ_03395 [Streptomyces sp. NPDC050421]|uniref:hypothetical protein n=1 Tax=unclassified Streptomyces TaxID=2593676 RepID=UPI0037ABEAFC
MKKDNKELGMERDVLERCMVLWVKQLPRTRTAWQGSSAARGPSTAFHMPWPVVHWA